jgi:hypothetical protein
MSRLTKQLPVLLILVFLGFLYLRTIAPGLTWAFDGADGGDLVTAVATGGVPHPSGYPAYLLIASLFIKIPLGSLAFRTNLLSVFFTIATAFMIYTIVRELGNTIFSASIASLVFGTFPLVWSQAIITEVYALNAFFISLILYFFIKRFSNPLMDLAWGCLAGLGIGNHLTIAFTLPLMFVGPPGPAEIEGVSIKRSIFRYIRVIAIRLLGLCLGLCVYLVIPIRAATEAPINWGNAKDLNGLFWLVTGKMYWGRMNDFSFAYLLKGTQAWSHFMFEQLGIYGILLVFIVLALLFSRSRFYLATGWLILIYSIFSILYYSPDSYIYLIPALLAISVWMGLSAEWVAERFSSRALRWKPLFEFILLGLILIHGFLEIPKMDLSADHAVDKYAKTILNSAPTKAILFSEGDEATFALWYYVYAYHQRPDMAIISNDLLSEPWYQAVLKYTYPDLVVGEDPQEQDIILDNPTRPACQLGSDLQATLSCSP